MKPPRIGKRRIEIMQLAERRGFVTFADMPRNVMPELIYAGLMKHYGERFKTAHGTEEANAYVLTEAGREFLENLKKGTGDEAAGENYDGK